jgi:4-diphosphocytidyl-2-C-methyl-D-erythritol kinase
MQLFAPAKINLSLKILNQRRDGFHEIETVIAPVSLSDDLTIEKQNRWIDLQCDDPSVPTGQDNLVVSAAKAFFERTKQKGGVTIRLTKKIPHGAGLGGGSSDAATTLIALNRLFDAKLSRGDLAKLASTIGSDIPFFLFESAAICRGRGEFVEPIKLREKLPVLLLKPAFGVPTNWAYSRWQESREVPGASYSTQKFAGQTFANDLERPVFEKFVFLAELKTWLLQQPEVGAALMSGSGSTVFAALRSQIDADALGQRVRMELDGEIWTCPCETR